MDKKREENQEPKELQSPLYNMHDPMIGLYHCGADEFTRDCRFAEVTG